MTAFLDILRTFGIWIYLAGVIGILFGIKMLLDARRARRTTLFTLEQEQASDRAFRAMLLMSGSTLLIAVVALINNFVAPAIPEAEPIVEPTEVVITPVIFLPTATQQPTLSTDVSATRLYTPTPLPTVPPTRAPQPTPQATLEPTPNPTPPTAGTDVSATRLYTPTSDLIYPQPALNHPPNGDSIGSNFIRFDWGIDEHGNLAVPALLPPDQFYRLTISYTDRTTNRTVLMVKCLHENSMDTRTGIRVQDTRGNAVDFTYSWFVIIVRAASQQECETGGGSPQSPPSPTFHFILP